jgi:hypothetical protein
MEAERSFMRPYPTSSRGREMSGHDHDRAIGEGLEEAPPCRSRRFRVNTEAAVELRLGTLVATDYAFDAWCALSEHPWS